MGSVSASVKGFAAAAGMIVAVAALASRESALAAVPERAPIAPATSGSLCTPVETTLFTCAIGTRHVSICGGRSGATYRYGRPGRIELASNRVAMATAAFSGGGETQITAANRDYTYTVFAKTVRTAFDGNGQNDPQSLSGLLVRRGGKTLSEKACGDDAPILARARSIVPTGRFVPH